MVMRPAWLRALTGCQQMIVRDDDDIEVEAGEDAPDPGDRCRRD
jgi:hypothetical protein